MVLLYLIINYFRTKKYLVLLYLVMMILDAIVALLSVFALVPVIQFMTSNNMATISDGYMKLYFEFISYANIEYSLESSLWIFVFFIVLSSVSSIILHYVSRLNAYTITYELTCWAIYKFYGQGLSFINSHSFGIIQNTFGREISRVADAVHSIFQLISITIFTLLMFNFSLELSYQMTSVILISISIVALTMSILGSKISELSNKAVSSANDLSNRLYNPLLNAKHVLSFARKQWAYDEYTDAFYVHVKDALRAQVMTFMLPEFFKTLSVVIAVVALFYSLSQGEELALLLATLAIFIRVLPKVAGFTQAYAMIKDATPSIQQYNKLFPRKDHIKHSQKVINEFQSVLELENVSFSYQTRENVLSDINIKIKKNSFVSFVGHSGSGKTSCMDILMGLYIPTSGKVLVDGVPINEVDLNSYLGLVGYVQQDTTLLDGSIRDNLLWANPNASVDDMWESLRLVSIDNFIHSLPDELDSLVGDRGVSLSGGQKQRIALALALVRKPEILILDEVTSALDSESEAYIRQSLSSLAHKLTIVSVTHRPSMAQYSDFIYVFDNGKVVESGIYKELMKNENSFLCRMKGED